MAYDGLVCQHCGRPIAVPGLKCPWPGCGKTIMVICAACKQYTDVDGAFCQQCGEPLVAANAIALRSPLRPQAIIANLAADQQRAQLVASGVIAQYPNNFFADGTQSYPVLVDLFGIPATPQQQAEVLLFSAVAYLVTHGYGTLQRGAGLMGGFLWQEALAWEGQIQGLEGQLALGSRMEATLLEALQRAVAEAVGFRLEVRVVDEEGYTLDRTEADMVALSLVLHRIKEEGRRSLDNLFLANTQATSTRVRAWMACPTATGVVEMARQTVLPCHEEEAACQETHQMLADFVKHDAERAVAIVADIGRVLRWFERCQQDPGSVTRDL
ncbi:MAG: zinc ribbon domain-containing protein [Anaerolineae bacterium]